MQAGKIALCPTTLRTPLAFVEVDEPSLFEGIEQDVAAVEIGVIYTQGVHLPYYGANRDPMFLMQGALRQYFG